MNESATTSTPDMDVTLQGDFPPGIVEYARKKVAAAVRHVTEPVLSVRVRLTRHADPAVAQPVTARANIDVNGRIVHAGVAAETARESIDLLEARLRRELEGTARHWEARRGRMSHPEPHERRHHTARAARPAYFPRPEGEREIISRQSHAPVRMTIDQAAFEMEQQDYDFYLFSEAGSGQDAMVFHGGPTGYRLALVEPVPTEALSDFSLDVTISGQPAARLSASEALEWLDLSGLPFLFYRDAGRGRGAVVYRRHDGHYGLILPIAE
jgi:ribosome-associated translation inhibitor RaiA